LGAAGKQLSRWNALLEKVTPSAESGEFELPSYVEPEKRQAQAQAEWNGPIDGRSFSERYLEGIGKKWDEMDEYQKKMLRDMEAGNESYKRREAMVMGGVNGVIGS
jgi:hypothetical protein